MEAKNTAAVLSLELKKLEIKEKKLEIENMERRLSNVAKGIIIDQISTLSNLLQARVLGDAPPAGEIPWINAFDEDDQIKIKAKIMRLINTF